MTPRPPTTTRLTATVRGMVQGVGYRYFVVREAEALGLVGWVANAPDGSVRLEAEGPLRALEALVALLPAGPRSAEVDGVEVSWMVARGDERGFSVRYSAHRGD